MERRSRTRRLKRTKSGISLHITWKRCKDIILFARPNLTNCTTRYKQANDPHLKWAPAEKKNELFNKKSRFILLEKEGADGSESELEAFCMFRFESEVNDKGVKEFIIYM